MRMCTHTHTQRAQTAVSELLGKMIILLSLNGCEFKRNPAIIVKTHTHSLPDSWLQHQPICIEIIFRAGVYIHLLFFHFCLVLLRQIKHSFKHNSIQINSNTELRWYNLDKPMLVHSVPTAHWRWEKMGKKCSTDRQHFCHRRCSKHLIDADSRINLALFSILSLSADILKRPNLTLS